MSVTAGVGETRAYGADPEALRRQDPEIADVLDGEARRQEDCLQLVAAENFTSPAVLAALGSRLANKYAEGYPGARYHGGCEYADAAERLAADRARALFGAAHANVQPHSGSAAVLAACAALLRPGDTVLAMGLAHGGHLTHGSPANFSGRWFDFVPYGVDAESGLVDHEQVRALAHQHRPKAIVCGSIAYPRHLDYAAFREIADEVGAALIVDAAHPIGLVAGGVAPNPVPYADVVCATTHKVLRGRAAACCCATGNWPGGSTVPCSRSPRAAPRCTPSPPRPWPSARRRPRLRGLRTAGRGQRARPRRGARRTRLLGHHRRHGHPPGVGRSGAPRRRRAGRAGGPRGRRDRGGHLRPAVRPRARDPPGDGGGDHAGDGSGRDGADRGAVRVRPAGPAGSARHP